MAAHRTSDSLDRLREFAERHSAYADDRSTWAREEEPNLRRRTRNYGPNTMAPPEEVVDARRRARHRVNNTPEVRGNSGMTENLILLAGMILSIYALYRVCIYLLSQGY